MAYSFELETTYTGQERHLHASVVFNNRMYVIQGTNAAVQSNIGASDDGITWDWAGGGVQAPTNARYGHKVCVFNKEIYLVGGYDGSAYMNDCWRSGDGLNWTRLTNTVWSVGGRRSHELVVFDGRMFLIGGLSSAGYHGDVWTSVDGTTWNLITTGLDLPWTERYGHACCVFDNRIWLTGGYDFTAAVQSDVWATQNGIEWTRYELPADFAARVYHTMTVYDGKMVIIGGSSNIQGTALTDLYYSAVGTAWKRGIQTLPFSRYGHTTLDFNGRLYVLAGSSTTYTATVYRSNSMEWQDQKIV